MGCSCNNNQTITINVEGMSCNHCKAAVENALKQIGVNKVEVDLAAKKVSASYSSDKLTLDDIKKSIIDAGYEVVG
ncbi:copper ion binding protein [Desulfofarcimen acetoxidans DSM 771]|uniref:Copper ion binding protein n=1 Tax=Desulfofarcimen acetoxidans (strain ATCC 49208 / DSM 771 / KCTC 5769 / VKM B-1644 / 5575) TaxID=485916 RepID=C8VXK6_DESAS|nr:copper ion binding protein [Desulfofarcimen acetoxidans]ACV62662.1 copper ion binding protein [Desulfofarcimen acetoxidans DSM 771]